MALAESEDPDFKHHVLPLARIKKVMKSDEDVQVSFLPPSVPSLFYGTFPPNPYVLTH